MRGKRSEAWWATALYVLVVVPAGVVVQRLRDPLRLRRPAGSNWSDAARDDASVERARRMR